MAEVASAYVSLIPSAKGFQSGIEKEIGGATVGAGKKAGGNASKGFKSSFLPGLKSLAGPVAGFFAVSKAIDFFKDANAEARDAQKVGALTTQVIKSTGGAAKVTAKHVGNLATAISKKAGIDDEAIQSGENLILTFKNIRNESGKNNKIFDQTTQVMTDMSAALGQDMKSSAIQLGKALNDPIKGVTALQRVGVSFDDGQKKQIKTLVKHNDLIGAQKIVLKELTSEFGGAAAAQATAGDKLKVAWGNFEEQVGTALLPTLDKLSNWFTNKAIPAASKFVTQMQNGKGAGGKFADGIGKVKDALVTAFDEGKKLVNLFNGLPSGLKKAIGIAAAGGLVASKIPGVKSLVGHRGRGLDGGSGLLGLVSKSRPIPVFVTNEGFGGGLPGKGKGGKPKIPGTPLPLASVPYLTPLLTKGDSAPGQSTAGMSKDAIKHYRGMQAALTDLYKALGLSASGFSKAGRDADTVLSDLIKSDPGKAFKLVKRASDTAGVSVEDFAGKAMPKTQAAVKHATTEFGGLDKAAAGVKAGADRLSREIFGTSVAMNKSGMSAKEYRAKLKSLPPAVQTKVTTPGAIQSRADVQRLQAQYKLTKPQLRTVVALSGVGAAEAAIRRFGGMLDGLDNRTVRTFVRVTTQHMDTRLKGQRATGGPVIGNRTYLVGENGPELFTAPNGGGRIIPNTRLDASLGRGGSGGAGVVQNIYDRSGDPRRTAAESARQLRFAGVG